MHCDECSPKSGAFILELRNRNLQSMSKIVQNAVRYLKQMALLFEVSLETWKVSLIIFRNLQVICFLLICLSSQG